MRHRQAIALLALVGLFVASYLWLNPLVGGEIKCGTGGCDVVQASRWARFLSVPVAFYGVAGYAAILAIALFSLRPATLASRRPPVWLAALATGGFVFTLWLTYLELFVIHAICRWCVASAVIITAIWIVSLAALRTPALRTDPSAGPPRRDRPAS